MRNTIVRFQVKFSFLVLDFSKTKRRVKEKPKKMEKKERALQIKCKKANMHAFGHFIKWSRWMIELQEKRQWWKSYKRLLWGGEWEGESRLAYLEKLFTERRGVASWDLKQRKESWWWWIEYRGRGVLGFWGIYSWQLQ